MTIVTIPKELANQKDLVAVPRAFYREFLRWQEAIKSRNTFTPTKGEKADLQMAQKNRQQGKHISLSELEYGLGDSNRQKGAKRA